MNELEPNNFMRSKKLRNDDDEQQLSLQPLLELNDPRYNYDDYEYDIDEDEEGYDENLSYQEYNTEILNPNEKKQNIFGTSKKLLPDKNSFKQNSLSPEHHSSFHPNSVLPISKKNSIANEPMKQGAFSSTNSVKGHYMASKSKYHKNYMLQNHMDATLSYVQESHDTKKSTSITTSINGGSDLPQFLRDPEDSYVIRRKSATLVCEVTGADKAYFSCNGEAMGKSAKDGDKKSLNRGQHHEEDTVRLADEKDMTGRMITVKILSLEVTEGQIEEFFGVFTCRCDAWNKKGRSSSKNASVEIACKYDLN